MSEVLNWIRATPDILVANIGTHNYWIERIRGKWGIWSYKLYETRTNNMKPQKTEHGRYDSENDAKAKAEWLVEMWAKI